MNPTIERNFNFHPPGATSKGSAAHSVIRQKAKELAQLIDDLSPKDAGREKALALTKVEEAMMWACAGICRHAPNDPDFSS
jgi:hypothetical protein